MKKIGIVVVHHSGVQHSKNLMSSVSFEENIRPMIRMWFVDNSEDKTEAEALSRFIYATSADVSIFSVKNRGYFSGANKGINEALKWGAENVVICNNDVVFAKDFFEIMVKTDYPPKVMMVYPELKSSNGISQNPRAENPVGPLRIICYFAYYRNYIISSIIKYLYEITIKKITHNLRTHSSEKNFRRIGMRKICLGVGACFVLTPAYFREFSGLPEDVFLFGEEAILADRISLSGGLILYDPHLKVSHEEHSTVGKMPSIEYWKIQKASSRIYLKSLWHLWWRHKIRWVIRSDGRL